MFHKSHAVGNAMSGRVVSERYRRSLSRHWFFRLSAAADKFTYQSLLRDMKSGIFGSGNVLMFLSWRLAS